MALVFVARKEYNGPMSKNTHGLLFGPRSSGVLPQVSFNLGDKDHTKYSPEEWVAIGEQGDKAFLPEQGTQREIDYVCHGFVPGVSRDGGTFYLEKPEDTQLFLSLLSVIVRLDFSFEGKTNLVAVAVAMEGNQRFCLEKGQFVVVKMRPNSSSPILVFNTKHGKHRIATEMLRVVSMVPSKYKADFDARKTIKVLFAEPVFELAKKVPLHL